MTRSIKVGGSHVIVLTAAQLEAILRKSGCLPSIDSVLNRVSNMKRAESLERACEVLIEAWNEEIASRHLAGPVPYAWQAGLPARNAA